MKIYILVALMAVGGCQATTSFNGTPTTSRNLTAPTAVVREVHDLLGGARVEVSFQGDTMHVNAVSPGGIGRTRIELTSGDWPKRAVVHLSYGPGEPFTMLMGPHANLEQADTKGDELPLPIRKLEGGFEITSIPATKMRVMHISWIDEFRH